LKKLIEQIREDFFDGGNFCTDRKGLAEFLKQDVISTMNDFNKGFLGLYLVVNENVGDIISWDYFKEKFEWFFNNPDYIHERFHPSLRRKYLRILELGEKEWIKSNN